MEIIFKMTEKEMVRLYQYLSSEYEDLDLPMKELLHRLEKELFDSLTISQIEILQKKIPGEA